MDRIQLRKIDSTNIADHCHLQEGDQCLYLYEYTSGKNYSFGTTNSLISNLKKSPSRRGTAEYRYKEQDIRNCALKFADALNPEFVKIATFVPVPPSKAKTDPEYDDRVAQICRQIGQQIDLRELLVQKASIRAAHTSPGNRPSIAELAANYTLEERLCSPAPKSLAIVDDVLTNGTHFKAASRVLNARFPDVPIYGLFVARRVFPDPSDII